MSKVILAWLRRFQDYRMARSTKTKKHQVPGWQIADNRNKNILVWEGDMAAKKKIKATKVRPVPFNKIGTNAPKRRKPQLQRPPVSIPQASASGSMGSGGPEHDLNSSNNPYVKPGVTKKPQPSLHRQPAFTNGIWLGKLRKSTKKTR